MNMVYLPSGFPAEQVVEGPAGAATAVLPVVTGEALPAVGDLGLDGVVRVHRVLLGSVPASCRHHSLCSSEVGPHIGTPPYPGSLGGPREPGPALRARGGRGVRGRRARGAASSACAGTRADAGTNAGASPGGTWPRP